MTEQPVGSVFGRAWALLASNWIIIVPGLVIGVIVGVLRTVLTPTVVIGPDGPVLATGSVLASVSSGLLIALVSLVGYIATVAYTTGMAGAAWQRGVTRIEDGAAAFRTDAGSILVTALGLFVLGVVAAILSFPTLGLSLLAYYLFTLYAMPAAILGNLPGFAAIQASFRIALKRLVPTLMVGLLIAVIALIVGAFAGVLRLAPLVGPIVAACVTQAAIAYATLVIVGEYLALRGSAASGPPPYGPPPSSNRL